MRTSARSRFGDSETARQALVRSARECTQLDRLAVPETVLVAQPADDGACWIWTVRPDLDTVEALLASTSVSPDVLSAYAVGLVEALRTSLRHGIAIDFGPASFGLQCGVVRYVGELASGASSSGHRASTMHAAFDAVERSGADLGLFLDAVERELSRLTPDERLRGRPSVGDGGPTRSIAERVRAVVAGTAVLG